MIGERFSQRDGHLPDCEVAFHNLQDSELEACLCYEHFREISLVEQDHVLFVAERLEKSRLSENEKFAKQLELQTRLDNLRLYTRPWLLLKQQEKALHLQRGARKLSNREEPVRLAIELTRQEIVLARFGMGNPSKKVELIVDWSQTDKELSDSFIRLRKRLVHTSDGADAEVRAKRHGGRRSSPREGLFQLAVWRCRRVGMSTEKILKKLEPLRMRFGAPAEGTLRKKLSSIERTTERTLQEAVRKFPLSVLDWPL